MPEKVEENEDADEIVDEVSTNEMQGSSIFSMDNWIEIQIYLERILLIV